MVLAPEPAEPTSDELRTLTARFVLDQAEATARLGSRLYAHLMRGIAANVDAGGVAWRILRPHASPDRGAALTLRFMAAVHRLVLTGAAPELEPIYPSHGGSGETDGAWEAFEAVLTRHAAELTELVGWSCQTNEVGRAAGLLPGFLEAVRAAPLPVRLLEIGASAGLQLRWDHFRYEWDERPDRHYWGPRNSPVRLTGHWDVPESLLGVEAHVVERAGCDPDPVDIDTEEGGLRLRQSVWADQPQRFARLNGALELARRIPATVDRASATDWLPPRLAEPTPGLLTIVYHSVVWQYLAPGERSAVESAIRAAGARTTREAPLAWVRSEPEDILRSMRVRLTLWPGGEERLVATAGAHGFPVRYQAV